MAPLNFFYIPEWLGQRGKVMPLFIMITSYLCCLSLFGLDMFCLY